MLQSDERRRSVAARTTQATARGDLLLQVDFDSAVETSSVFPKLASLVHQVAAAGRDAGVYTFHIHTLLAREQLNFQVIVKVDGLIERSDFVVTVRTLPEYSQPQIDLGKGVKRNGVFHKEKKQ
jgi:hypothetical protein